MKTLLCVSALVVLIPLSAAGSDWPGFRNLGNSISPTSSLPIEWSEDEGIAWRATLAGYGQSSPIVYDGTVWVTSTTGANKETLILEGFDLASGDCTVSFETKTASTVEEVTEMISQGAPTPVADGQGVYVFFESGDLIALDPSGNKRWRRSLTEEFGPFLGGHGIGSSLAQSEDRIYLLIDHDGPSYLLAVNKSDGSTAWKTDRDPRVSWTSPLYLRHDDHELIIVTSNGQLAAYDSVTGELLGSLEGLEGNNVPSATWTGDQFLIGSSAPQQSRAVSMKTRDDGTLTFETVWKAGSVTSSFGSPIHFRGMGFFVNRAGALQSVSLEDGTSLWEARLPASTWASPVKAGDRLYFFCQDGTTQVLSPTTTGIGEPVSENSLPRDEGDRLYGAAAVEGKILLRFGRELVAVGKP